MQPVTDDPERPWHEPGVYRVAPDVHRAPLPMPGDGLKAVNAYVLTADDSLTVIDPGVGTPAAVSALEDALDALGAGTGDIQRVLVTHIHYDHYSQAIALRRANGTPVSLGRHEQPSLEVLRRPYGSQTDQMRRLQKYGSSELAGIASARRRDEYLDSLLQEGPDEWIEAETVREGLRAIHTPGHTRGHVVFRDEERSLLFAGDHVLPSITPSIGFEPAVARLPLGAYLQSLHAVRTLPDTRLLPAHGAVTQSVHDRIDELVEHHATRLGLSATAIDEGASTALEVAQQLKWTRYERRFDELNTFNRMLAVFETGFHLDLLVERGTLKCVVQDHVAQYSSN